MSTVYGIYGDPDAAQRAVDVLSAAGADLHFRRQQIVVVSAEPFDGYDFSDKHADTHIFRLALLGGVIGGAFGLGDAVTSRATGGLALAPWTLPPNLRNRERS